MSSQDVPRVRVDDAVTVARRFMEALMQERNELRAELNTCRARLTAAQDRIKTLERVGALQGVFVPKGRQP